MLTRALLARHLHRLGFGYMPTPGVIGSKSNFIEHPQLIAQRIASREFWNG